MCLISPKGDGSVCEHSNRFLEKPCSTLTCFYVIKIGRCKGENIGREMKGETRLEVDDASNPEYKHRRWKGRRRNGRKEEKEGDSRRQGGRKGRETRMEVDDLLNIKKEDGKERKKKEEGGDKGIGREREDRVFISWKIIVHRMLL